MRNFKIILSMAVIVTIFILVLFGADLVLYPCTFMRNDIHAISENTFDDVFVGTSHG